ncbi:MAG: peptide-methionine (S)-S-oxide reductase MsrA [Candidatus Sumerlaeota bacterium]|nr:peptide-methionine (S)-S-oxide reductase MsrA [Candidatus Sumerlaeota bacterium]
MIRHSLILIAVLVGGVLLFELKKNIASEPAQSPGAVKIADKGADTKMETATFGAGCFWGVEEIFRQLKGVQSTAVGFMGGHTKHPSYKDVCRGDTGHAEVMQIEFDPKVISYEDLLQIFWDSHDPTTKNRQGPDVGEQYRSVIFTHSDAQKGAAVASRDRLQQMPEFKNRKIVTEIAPAGDFWRAEDYHQRYFEKSGNAAACHVLPKSALDKLAPKSKAQKTDAEWKKILTPEQYDIMREKGTEQPFTGAYWKTKTPGVYVCAACGKTLFDSKSKFDSGCGWPSFTKPVGAEDVKYTPDHSHGMNRIEVTCPECGAHLGHVFDDGPQPTGKRFCINSVSLKLMPEKKK